MIRRTDKNEKFLYTVMYINHQGGGYSTVYVNVPWAVDAPGGYRPATFTSKAPADKWAAELSEKYKDTKYVVFSHNHNKPMRAVSTYIDGKLQG